MRKYMLIYDTQHSHGEITFKSDYRANSKKNIADAKKEMRLKLGKVFEIEQIYLIKE